VQNPGGTVKGVVHARVSSTLLQKGNASWIATTIMGKWTWSSTRIQTITTYRVKSNVIHTRVYYTRIINIILVGKRMNN
jgi:hypothetical protein